MLVLSAFWSLLKVIVWPVLFVLAFTVYAKLIILRNKASRSR